MTADDVTRAVTAGGLLRERQVVIARLRQLGVHVLEADHRRLGPALVQPIWTSSGKTCCERGARRRRPPDAGRLPCRARGRLEAFEALLTRVEKRAPRALSDDELLALPVLYRSTLSSLSVARATSLDNALIAYLERLCPRGYFFVYGARRGLPRRIADFFPHDWPDAIRDLWRETLVAVALMAVGAVAGFLLVRSDKSWFDAIIPADLAAGRGPDASAELLRRTLYDGGDEWLSGFATFLFTHNVQVAIVAFALGFALACRRCC